MQRAGGKAIEQGAADVPGQPPETVIKRKGGTQVRIGRCPSCNMVGRVVVNLSGHG